MSAHEPLTSSRFAARFQAVRSHDRFGGGRRVLALVALGALAKGSAPAWQAWNDIRNQIAHYVDIGLQRQAVMDVAHSVEEVRPTLRGVFTEALAPDILQSVGELPELVVSAFALVEELDTVSEDVLGPWFDAAVDEVAAGRDSPIFTTPPALASLMVDLSAPQPGDRVLDPCSGLGSILARTADYGAAFGQKNTLKLYGQEIDAVTAALSRLRLYFLGHTAEVVVGDALRAPARWETKGGFDRVICDPPYGGMVSRDDQAIVDRFPGVGRRYEALFIAHCLDQLAPEGRAVVLTPYGFLSRGGREANLRAKLIERGRLEGVIALPPGLLPFTEIGLALLVLRGHDAPSAPIRFLDADFLTAKGRRPSERLTSAAISSLVSQYNEAAISEHMTVAEVQTVLVDGAVLQPSRFIKKAEQTRPDLWILYERAQEAETRAEEARLRFDALLHRFQTDN